MIKKLSFLISIIIIILCILSSCTMQKRHYTQGYHIDWNHSKNKQPATVKSSSKIISEKIILLKKTELISTPKREETILASNNHNPVIVLPLKKARVAIKELASPLTKFKSHKLNSTTHHKNKKPDEVKKKVSGFLISGIILVTLSIALVIIGLIIIMNSEAFSSVLLLLTLLWAALIFLILGFVLLAKGL